MAAAGKPSCHTADPRQSGGTPRSNLNTPTHCLSCSLRRQEAHCAHFWGSLSCKLKNRSGNLEPGFGAKPSAFIVGFLHLVRKKELNEADDYEDGHLGRLVQGDAGGQQLPSEDHPGSFWRGIRLHADAERGPGNRSTFAQKPLSPFITPSPSESWPVLHIFDSLQICTAPIF